MQNSAERGAEAFRQPRILHGDCREIIPTLPENSVDAIVTDPPYEIGFMGRSWDRTGVAFDPATWAVALRVLKPGGHLLAFGGSKTFHRIAVAIEDAGFEIRDTIMWVYGSGFPKHGSALKPAFEPIVLARKPLSERNVAGNAARWGTGALNIDECRIASGDTWPDTGLRVGGEAVVAFGDGLNNAGRSGAHTLGRWPANLIHDGSPEVVAAFPDRTVNSPSQALSTGGRTVYRGGWSAKQPAFARENHGSAARFFYAAKASKADRAGSKHPTVKPQSLMRYLCRLVTPPGGTVVDCFAGSGSTLQAARDEGFAAIGIEQSAEYVADIERRLRVSADLVHQQACA